MGRKTMIKKIHSISIGAQIGIPKIFTCEFIFLKNKEN
jgi:hypothetical protein